MATSRPTRQRSVLTASSSIRRAPTRAPSFRAIRTTGAPASPTSNNLQQIVIGDQWSQFLAGNLDTVAIAAEVQQGFKTNEEVLKKAGVEAYTNRGVSYGSAQGHFMNNTTAPFNDLRVRQAINLLLDRDPQLTYGLPIGGYRSVALGAGHVEAGFGLQEKEVIELPGYRNTRPGATRTSRTALPFSARRDLTVTISSSSKSWAGPSLIA